MAGENIRIPVTREFNDNDVVGFVELTPEFKKQYEQNLIDSGVGGKNILVLSPAYLTNFADEQGVIHSAELIELSAIPAHRTYQRREEDDITTKKEA